MSYEHKPTKWLPEQENFLNTFYGQITDPETKYSMLIEATGGGSMTFHAVGINTEGKLQGFSDSQVLISTKIKCLEHDLLVLHNLLKPNYF